MEIFSNLAKHLKITNITLKYMRMFDVTQLEKYNQIYNLLNAEEDTTIVCLWF